VLPSQRILWTNTPVLEACGACVARVRRACGACAARVRCACPLPAAHLSALPGVVVDAAVDARVETLVARAML